MPSFREPMPLNSWAPAFPYLVHVHMHVCPGTMCIMEAIEGPLPITDTDISHDQALVRGLIVRRLEAIWRSCEPHLRAQHDPDTGLMLSKPDPRFVEAGIRVCRDLGKIYRLEAPVPPDPGEGQAPVALRELVARQLAELEARIKGSA